jgi:hypothetical protein
MIYIENLAHVVTWFDEECPYDYVLQWSENYEAFAGHINGDTVDSISIGHYPTISAAIDAIHKWQELDGTKVLQ